LSEERAKAACIQLSEPKKPSGLGFREARRIPKVRNDREFELLVIHPLKSLDVREA
jgi:hypothetical protein